ncbi:MAG: PAS domain-containing sensor histidine kinase [Desulfobacteraceae bacterium]|nr:MAG: PAS domain-containing sensor histidine kinase [Desulfobacteraceae bacterium]
MTGKPTYEQLEQRIKELESLASARAANSEMLSKNDSRYRTLFEAANDAICILEDFRIVECNKKTLMMFGCDTEEDIVGSYPWKFSPPTQPDGSSSKKKAISMKSVLLEGKPQRFYWKHARKDGREFDGEISLSPVGTGQSVSHLAIIRDISALKQVELALRESVEKYRILFDLESDALALIEIETGNMLEVNKAFVELYGYSREEILCMKNTDFSAEPEATRKVTRARGNYVPIRYHKKRDGTVFPTEITASIFKYQGRDVHIAAIRDITERMRLESQLQRAQKMKSLGLLAGGVAHDLNNVLSGIVSLPDLILMKLPEDNELRKPIETMQQAGYRAAAIVGDLLTVARGVATTRKPLNLNDQVNDYLKSPEFIKLRQYNPFVDIQTHFDPSVFNINGSVVHVRKVIMNLVANAAEAIEGSGTITISTANRYLDEPLRGYEEVKRDEYVVLSVSDNGSGIAPDELERVFEPFFTKKSMGRSGTGLGLAVVWNVMQDHNGYIDIKSGPDGTTFDLYFPITRDEVSCDTQCASIQECKGNGETILVVDDVASQREISCQLLNSLGYKTTSAASGEEAVNYLQHHAVDLLVLDMIMAPGINGRETYERILKIHPHQKAVLVSGFTETDEVKEVQKLGAGQFVAKPFKLERIGMAIKEELKR